MLWGCSKPPVFDLQASFLQGRLLKWLQESGLDAERTALVVKPALSSSAVGLAMTQGEEETLAAIGGLLEEVGWRFTIHLSSQGPFKITFPSRCHLKGCPPAGYEKTHRQGLPPSLPKLTHIVAPT